MAATPFRLPITNTVTGDLYTAALQIGNPASACQMLLDTGSAMLAVGSAAYNPAPGNGCAVTTILQTAQYLFNSFACGVVQTTVALPGQNGMPALQLPGVNVAVTYDATPNRFDNADGIWGLAYQALDNALTMPGITWPDPYYLANLNLGTQCDLQPLFDQLTASGLVAGKFAFRVQRAVQSLATDNPATDPLNNGLLVLGGGADCTDLYTGPFSQIAVVDAKFYNTNLLGVRVGNQPVIAVQPVAPGSNAASNAFVDSGTNSLYFYQGTYNAILAAFGNIRQDFEIALRQGAYGGAGLDQTTLNLNDWPLLQLILQTPGGGQSTISIHATNYWQFDSTARGQANAMIRGDAQNQLGGQSVLGLPFFAGNYVVFDRSAANGHGLISVAAQGP